MTWMAIAFQWGLFTGHAVAILFAPDGCCHWREYSNGQKAAVFSNQNFSKTMYMLTICLEITTCLQLVVAYSAIVIHLASHRYSFFGEYRKYSITKPSSNTTLSNIAPSYMISFLSRSIWKNRTRHPSTHNLLGVPYFLFLRPHRFNAPVEFNPHPLRLD